MLKVKALVLFFIIIATFSCSKSRPRPELWPIEDGKDDRVGFINSKGEVVIKPQFVSQSTFETQRGFSSSELAPACIGNEKCGYIDATGKLVIQPTFEMTYFFSEGLAAVMQGGKIGYIDTSGKIVINPQFNWYASGPSNITVRPEFSGGLAMVLVGKKAGFIDKSGKLVVNPTFDDAGPFRDGLARVKTGERFGYIDPSGKLAINPQFDYADNFSEGFAFVKVDGKYGFIDKTGKYTVNPQFDGAGKVSDGLARVQVGENWGYVDTSGKFVINPQYTDAVDFSEGTTLVRAGKQSGSDSATIILDKSGTEQRTSVRSWLAFDGDLARVWLSDGNTRAYINRDGQVVWRQGGSNSSNASNVATNSMANASNVAASNSMSNATSTSGRTGRLTTDSNIRSNPDKNSASLGIHYKGARLQILDETSYTLETGEISTWYKIKVLEYGCSADANLGCGKKPDSLDEGYVNAKNILVD